MGFSAVTYYVSLKNRGLLDLNFGSMLNTLSPYINPIERIFLPKKRDKTKKIFIKRMEDVLVLNVESRKTFIKHRNYRTKKLTKVVQKLVGLFSIAEVSYSRFYLI